MITYVLVNCLWSSWSDWSSCSKTCGGGVKERSKQVKTPAQNGGSQCQGSAKQTDSCNDQTCLGKFKNLLYFQKKITHNYILSGLPMVRLVKIWRVY